MTDNAKLILAELKREYPTEVTKQELAANLAEQGITVPAVTGTVTALVKKGLAVERIENTEVDRKAKSFRYVVLTDEGLRYDPEIEEAQKLAEKEAAKAARAAEREAAKAEKEAAKAAKKAAE